MISYQPARNEHFDELLEIVYDQDSLYLKPLLDLIQITCEEFGRRFRTTGIVYRILMDRCLAGVCWVEVCGRVLQLHGLILENAFQGKGIGTQTLSWLEEAFFGDIDEIRLSVHASNPRAKALYEHCGYETVDTVDQAGFYIMRKKVREKTLLLGV